MQPVEKLGSDLLLFRFGTFRSAGKRSKFLGTMWFYIGFIRTLFIMFPPRSPMI